VLKTWAKKEKDQHLKKSLCKKPEELKSQLDPENLRK
jgi:hypothetical protein